MKDEFGRPAADLATPKRERSIEAAVCAYAKRLGWLVDKYYVKGRPDRIFLRGGRVFFIEFKRPGAKPTPQQLASHRELQEAGFRVYVIDDVVEGRRVVDKESSVGWSTRGTGA